MNLNNVVSRIIAGFAFFGCIIIIINVISYAGLAEIRDTAQTVVQQKMPVQGKMLDIQTGILSLAKVSTDGFYGISLSKLKENKQAFDQQAEVFTINLSVLNSIVNQKNATFKQGEQAALIYIEKSREMYQARLAQLELNHLIDTKATDLLAIADEASALMLDLSFLESDDPNLGPLIGSGLNVDNKISTLFTSIKEYIGVTDAELSGTIKGDIEFTLSNIQVDLDYINRLAETINTDGYVESFNQQFKLLSDGFNQERGLFNLQSQKIDLILLAEQQNQYAESHLATAIDQFSQVFSQINQDTLDGQNDIIEAAQLNIIKGLIIALIAVVIAIVLGAVATRSIAKPLARINRSLSIISSGDLTHKAYSANQDEFAKLADNVNQLSDNLHNVVSQIHLQEAALEQATKTSARLSNQTLSQVKQQKEKVKATANDTDLIREASKRNIEEIQTGMDKLHEVSKQSEQVTILVKEAHQQISEQSQQAQQSSTIIHRLEENSKKIGSILDVIKTIAAQTNLLALNAAIEAARAGEHGRGFAVVADEVRTLASRTHNSTEEIESMIATLQDDAEQAVNAIGLGSDYAKQSEQQIKQVDQQVAEIGETIISLRKMNQEIVSVSIEQDSLFENVANSLESIVELAELTADTTLSSTHATQELDQLMLEMKKAVSRFTL
jgi:methyl-accepting chemotaxis protein